MKATPSIIVAVCLFGCATPPDRTPAFVDRYVGTVATATLTIDLLRDLPRSPETGWLNLADPADAIGRFQAVRRRPIKFELTPHYVTFGADRGSERPGARYYWRGDTLVICMLNMTPGATKGSDKLVLVSDYDTCAPMQRVAK